MRTHSEKGYEEFPVGESPGTTRGDSLKVETRLAGTGKFAPIASNA